MKKFVIAALVVIIALGSLAWFKRTDILLGIVKYRFAATDIGPNRSISWQQCPLPPLDSGDQSPTILLLVSHYFVSTPLSTFFVSLL